MSLTDSLKAKGWKQIRGYLHYVGTIGKACRDTNTGNVFLEGSQFKICVNCLVFAPDFEESVYEIAVATGPKIYNFFMSDVRFKGVKLPDKPQSIQAEAEAEGQAQFEQAAHDLQVQQESKRVVRLEKLAKTKVDAQFQRREQEKQSRKLDRLAKTQVQIEQKRLATNAQRAASPRYSNVGLSPRLEKFLAVLEPSTQHQLATRYLLEIGQSLRAGTRESRKLQARLFSTFGRSRVDFGNSRVEKDLKKHLPELHEWPSQVVDRAIEFSPDNWDEFLAFLIRVGELRDQVLVESEKTSLTDSEENSIKGFQQKPYHSVDSGRDK